MTPSASSDVLTQIERQHPGLERFVRANAAGMGLRADYLLEGFRRELNTLGLEQARVACRSWEGFGILPGLLIHSDEQVAAIWTSPLFLALLNAVRFHPPGNTDIRLHRRPVVRSHAELADLAIPDVERSSYWQHVLWLTFPELYLEPFLPIAHDRDLVGCELACGWGRGVLSLRNYERRHIQCCDLSTSSLRVLEELAVRAAIRPHLSLVNCDIMELPFPDRSFDFFLGFDIFEHVTNTALERILQEILRCARPGAVLYAEIPLHAYCPAATHLQDFTWARVAQLFRRATRRGRRFRPLCWEECLPSHFTFAIA
jgi:methyltransferase family protein